MNTSSSCVHALFSKVFVRRQDLQLLWVELHSKLSSHSAPVRLGLLLPLDAVAREL